MEHLSAANSTSMFLAVVFLLVCVIFQALFFYSLARKRAKELNISSDIIKTASRAAIISSIVPSIAIIIGLFTLAPVLGIPVSWARLSMIGSLVYEVIAATIGATTMGAEGLGKAGFTPQAFANSVWVMTIGVYPPLLITFLFLKKYKRTVKEKASKDSTWNGLMVSTIMIALFSNFLVPSVLQGGNGRLAVIISGLTMGLLTYVITKFKVKWLNEYALSFSMIAAMAVIVLINI